MCGAGERVLAGAAPQGTSNTSLRCLSQEELAAEGGRNSSFNSLTAETPRLRLAIAGGRSALGSGWVARASAQKPESRAQLLLMSSGAFSVVGRRIQVYGFPSLLQSPSYLSTG